MGFYIFISVLILVVCVLLGLIVLVQNPKGGGLSSTFGGQGNQYMGVRKTADFLEKGTWVLSIVLLVLSLVAAYVIPKPQDNSGAPQTELSVDQNMVLPTSLPTAGSPSAVPVAPVSEPSADQPSAE